jgi:hypothetical protein
MLGVSRGWSEYLLVYASFIIWKQHLYIFSGCGQHSQATECRAKRALNLSHVKILDGYYSPFLSMALPGHSGPRPLIQFRNHFYTDGRTPWTSDQPVARPLPKHRTTQTQNKRIHTPNIHALNGIRTHDPSFRASEDSSCLRPRGYCDRPIIVLTYLKVSECCLTAFSHKRRIFDKMTNISIFIEWNILGQYVSLIHT